MGCQSSRSDDYGVKNSFKRPKVKQIDHENNVEIVTEQTLQYKRIQDELTSTGQQYNDEDFPPCMDSIMRNKSDPRYEQLKDTKWVRVKEIVRRDQSSEEEKAMQMFSDIKQDDIRQGTLGVCYFLCSLSLLASNPDKVKECFNTKEINEQGIYSLNFYVMGSKYEIMIDDQFPVTSQNNPLFCRPNGNEIWVMVLEKAWCKMFRTYTLAEGGLPHVSMEYLTGCPSQAFSQANDSQLWKDRQSLAVLLMNNHRQGYQQAAGTKVFGGENVRNGIVSGHAYSIMKVADYKQETIIKLYNPWGKTEFKGKYSEDKKIWQDQELQALFNQRVIKDDGMFYMTVAEFQKSYDQFSVCYIKANYKIQQTIKLNVNTDEESLIGFTIDNSNGQTVNLRVHQLLSDIVQQDDYHYSSMQFRVFKKNSDSSISLVTNGGKHKHWGYHSISHDDGVFTHFPQGEYFIYIVMYWHNDVQRDLNLSAFSDQSLSFKIIDKSIGKQFIADYRLQIATNKLKINKKMGFEQSKTDDDRAKIIYMKNTNTDKQLIVTYTLRGCQNYGFTDNHGPTDDKRVLEINPGETKLCRLEPLDYYKSYLYKMSTNMKQKFI